MDILPAAIYAIGFLVAVFGGVPFVPALLTHNFQDIQEVIFKINGGFELKSPYN